MMDDTFPRYHVNLFYSEEDEGWIAAVPDLQNCSAFGDSPEQALRELRSATEGWLECWMLRHDAPPPAQYRPTQAPAAA